MRLRWGCLVKEPPTRLQPHVRDGGRSVNLDGGSAAVHDGGSVGSLDGGSMVATSDGEC